jgi:hypothetical protein
MIYATNIIKNFLTTENIFLIQNRQGLLHILINVIEQISSYKLESPPESPVREDIKQVMSDNIMDQDTILKLLTKDIHYYNSDILQKEEVEELKKRDYDSNFLREYIKKNPAYIFYVFTNLIKQFNDLSFISNILFEYIEESCSFDKISTRILMEIRNCLYFDTSNFGKCVEDYYNGNNTREIMNLFLYLVYSNPEYDDDEIIIIKKIIEHTHDQSILQNMFDIAIELYDTTTIIEIEKSGKTQLNNKQLASIMLTFNNKSIKYLDKHIKLSKRINEMSIFEENNSRLCQVLRKIYS